MPVVITLIITIFLVFIGWTWHNLGNIEKEKKILTILILTIVLFIITFVVFSISTKGINYNTKEEMESVRNILVILFTFINGLVIMPGIAKTFGKINDKQISEEKAKKRFIILFILFFIFLFLECGYMKNIQQEILNIYNKALLIK